MNSTERAFSENLNSILKDSEKVIVAFSGGCDSLALLVLCTRALGTQRVIPVYVNHRLRSEKELFEEIGLNQENCRALGLELKVRELESGEVGRLAESRGGGLEDAARVLRYQVLEEERLKAKASYILTAHHRQDQVETIIMRLSKGSPVNSLKGISAIDSKRHLLRPLLDLSRRELEKHLVSEGFRWSTDSTNADACFSRNSVRNDVIPRIQAIWPDYEACILNLGRQAERLGSGVPEDLGSEVELSAFEGRSAIQRTLVLYSMWGSVFTDKELPLSLVDRVLDAVAKAQDCSVGSNGAVFYIYRGRLYLTDPSQDERFKTFHVEMKTDAECRVELLDNVVFQSGVDLGSDDPLALRLDPTRFKGKVLIRYAQTGDRIRLKDGAKMVLRLLQDMKIPAQLRCRVPVLEDQDGICAVFGSLYGGRDRISAKFHTSLARNHFPLYIVSKGKPE